MAYVGGATLPRRLRSPGAPIRRPGLISPAQRQANQMLRQKRLQAPVVPRTGFHGGAAPFQMPPQAGGAPAPSPAAPSPAPSPLDAQYFHQTSQNQFSTNQRIAALNAQGANERTGLGESLRRLGLRQPGLEQSATNRANSMGLLHSGALGRQIGDLQTVYFQNQSDLNQRFAQAEAARRAEIEGLTQQLGFDDLAARLAAVERASQQAEDLPLVDMEPPGSVPSIGKTGPGRPRATTARPVLMRTQRAAVTMARQAAAQAQRQSQQQARSRKRGR